ncbi:MAG: DUF4160 domain-containing protein [Alphaproteobacteria bacterium]|nr:DUF4160 domain-containing protein [Alphaproteobacteria bacterium]
MPPVAVLGNVEILVYWNDTRKHKRPHFHAVGPERSSVFGIPDLDHIVGDLRGGEARAVLEWAETHGDELVRLWNERNPGVPVTKKDDGA